MSDPLHRQMFPLTFQEHGAAIRRPPAVPRRHGSGLRSRWHARLKEEIHESHPPYRPPRARRAAGRDSSTPPRRTALGASAAGLVAAALAACSSADSDAGGGSGSGGPVTIGFVAVGPEGAWRQANEDNIQETFTEDAGFTLKYAPATNLDQKSQIDAFSSFVDEGVGLILLRSEEHTSELQS